MTPTESPVVFISEIKAAPLAARQVIGRRYIGWMLYASHFRGDLLRAPRCSRESNLRGIVYEEEALGYFEEHCARAGLEVHEKALEGTRAFAGGGGKYLDFG